MNKLLQAVRERTSIIPAIATPRRNFKVNPLLSRLEMQRRLSTLENSMLYQVKHLHCEVKFIEHLPKCRVCKMEVQLDVERYFGKHSPWFLQLEASEYLEKRYPSCPKEREYPIGNYFEQLKHCEKHGTAGAWQEHNAVYPGQGKVGLQKDWKTDPRVSTDTSPNKSMGFH